MSHRVTVKTAINDKQYATEALKEMGYSYRESGNQLTITSGPMNRATLNLSTGEMVGDSDYHSEASLGLLRQNYALAKYKGEAFKQGISITSQTVEANSGDIVLTCSFG